MRFERSVFWTVVAILTLSACHQSPEAREAAFLDKGKKAFQKKDYAVAILHFKNASAAKAWDAEPYYLLGLSYKAEGDFQLPPMASGRPSRRTPGTPPRNWNWPNPWHPAVPGKSLKMRRSTRRLFWHCCPTSQRRPDRSRYHGSATGQA